MVVDDLRGGVLGSSLFAGCNNDDPVTPDAQPEIVFAKESLDVPAEGGPFQIEYTIENPVANATLSAKCNDSWITDIDTKTAGVISFNVTKNETAEKREAIIEVSYADIQPAPSFTAKQAARPEEAFTITISDITTKTFRTTVRPGDQEMYYLLNIIPSRAAADFKTDDELYQYDIDFYTDMDATGSGWQSWAQEYLEQGTIADRLIENMEPNTEYLVYAYGVDPITIERLTPISKRRSQPWHPKQSTQNSTYRSFRPKVSTSTFLSKRTITTAILSQRSTAASMRPIRMRPFWRKYRKVGSTTYRSTDGWATRPK